MIISFLLISSQSFAGSIYVVLHKENKTEFSKEMISKIYLGHLTHWDDGTKIMPIVNKSNKTEMKNFVVNILKMSMTRYKSYWRTKLFSGNGIPPRNIKRAEKSLNLAIENKSSIFYSFNKVSSKEVRVIEIEY